jgi:hypothetical protein
VYARDLSRDPGKAGLSLNTFLFTRKNRHNVPARGLLFFGTRLRNNSGNARQCVGNNHDYENRDATYVSQKAALHSICRLLSRDEVSIIASLTGLGRQLCGPGLELAFVRHGRLDLTTVGLAMVSAAALDEVLGGG